MSKPTLRLLALALSAAFAGQAAAVEIQLTNFDAGTGVGLDDPTPRAPVGGNPGTTLGEQRQIAYQYAADLWSAVLDGDTPVRVIASTQPLSCTPTGGTLAQAGALQVVANFAGSIPNTWYHVALAKGITGFDYPTDFDILTQFNGAIGVDPNCLTGSDWYYGLDGATPPGRINFLNVVMHEIAHGLGFSGFESVTNGQLLSGRPSIYATYAFDNTLGLLVRDMTPAQRFASFINDGNLVWTGPNVTAQAPLLLDNATLLQATAPAAIAGSEFDYLPAVFGTPATSANFGGSVVLADDGSATPTLGCGPLANAADVAGKLVLAERGVCAFTIKAANAQAAGATGLIIANSAPGVFAPGGADPAVTIPVIGVSQAAGTTLKANASGLAAALAVSSTRLAGTDANGRVQLYAPLARAPGSTYSHFDIRVTPNALMEPFNTASIQANYAIDLTPALFADEGWPLDTGNARIGNCDTGVPVQQDGGLIIGANLIAQSNVCKIGARNHGQYVSCMSNYTSRLRSAGLLPGNAQGGVQSCVARNK